MKKQIILTSVIGLVALSFISSAYSQSFNPIPKTPKINEDQIITCVKDVSETSNRNSLVCHIFNTDDLDWYQELSETNYGQIGSLDDSFEMGLID